MNQRVYYAIGDVHGMNDRLARLHGAIFADHQRHGGESTVIHLGDYVDRGPDSRGTIERIMALEEEARPFSGFRVLSLRGNHEQLLLDAFDSEQREKMRAWLNNGGEATLHSYGAKADASDWRACLPSSHLSWIRGLATLHHVRERRLAFVHAGIDPDLFPNCSDEVRMWTRTEGFFAADAWPRRHELTRLLVVHGHTPQEDFKIEFHKRRINVDTGAVFGGALTAVVLAPSETPRFIQA